MQFFEASVFKSHESPGARMQLLFPGSKEQRWRLKWRNRQQTVKDWTRLLKDFPPKSVGMIDEIHFKTNSSPVQDISYVWRQWEERLETLYKVTADYLRDPLAQIIMHKCYQEGWLKGPLHNAPETETLGRNWEMRTEQSLSGRNFAFITEIPHSVPSISS